MNSKDQKRIIVIQNKETQFDAPLFSLIERDKKICAIIYYSINNLKLVDSETGVKPIWDNLTNLNYRYSYISSIYDFLKEVFIFRPNLIIVGGWYPRRHILFAIIFRLMGFHVGVRTDKITSQQSNFNLKSKIKSFAVSIILNIYSSWFPVGTLARNYLQSASINPKPIFFFPYSVDVDWFIKSGMLTLKNRSSIRKSIGIEDDDYLVIGVMKWVEREDPITLLNAVALATKNCPRIRLILVGDGSLRDNVKEIASTIPRGVIMPGYIPYSDLPKFYSISDLFVHPAKSEPYGVSIQEAMSCGLPVIASTGVGSAVDYIEAGINGDFFVAGDAEDLSKLLSKYSRSNDTELANLRSVSKAKDWSYDRTISELTAALESVEP